MKCQLVYEQNTFRRAELLHTDRSLYFIKFFLFIQTPGSVKGVL